MKINAKQLTFLYFSVVASAIIIIHATVFMSTAEDMERLYAENRLAKISEYLFNSLEKHQIQKQAQFVLQTQGKAKFDPYIQVYFDEALIPNELGIPENLPLGVAFETEDSSTKRTYFVLKQNLGPSYGIAHFVLDNSFYELTEESLLTSQSRQILISSALLIVSLLIILQMATHLTRPISQVANDLANRPPQSMEPIKTPTGIIPKEIDQLIASFNDFQKRITELVEKERAFNRYASHELRTPLMVMKGAITLLGESNEPAFIEKQRQRLAKATNDMNEFIQTLLSLTKLTPSNQTVNSEITESELRNVVENHRYLLNKKTVITNITVRENLQITMPEPAFNILLGNLIKNAFTNTFEGQIDITVDHQKITITDTGIGLQDKAQSEEGYGLGLLLVKDICKKFGCKFSLVENEKSGCTACLVFPETLAATNKH